MPIRPECRYLYPIDWPQISSYVRFVRAKGRCEFCGRRHRTTIRQLPDGRWYDDELGVWRDDKGREASWPDICEYAAFQTKRVIIAAIHLDHHPPTTDPRQLKAGCGRCHLAYDREMHRRRRRITWLSRRALGDLFEGPYAVGGP